MRLQTFIINNGNTEQCSGASLQNAKKFDLLKAGLVRFQLKDLEEAHPHLTYMESVTTLEMFGDLLDVVYLEQIMPLQQSSTISGRSGCE